VSFSQVIEMSFGRSTLTPEMNCGGSISAAVLGGSPISYAIDGIQDVAIATGHSLFVFAVADPGQPRPVSDGAVHE
jgi:hypothetical protein